MSYLYLPKVTPQGLRAVALELCKTPPPGRSISFSRHSTANALFMEFESDNGHEVVVTSLYAPPRRFETEAELHAWLQELKENIDAAKQRCYEIDKSEQSPPEEGNAT